MADGALAGEIRSVTADRGLAQMRLDALESANLSANNIPVAVRIPDWLEPFTKPDRASVDSDQQAE